MNQAQYVQPVYDIYASVQGRDLGSVSDPTSEKVVAQETAEAAEAWQYDIGLLWPDPEHELDSFSGTSTIGLHVRRHIRLSADGRELSRISAIRSSSSWRCPATLPAGSSSMLFITGTDAQACPSLDGRHHGGRRSFGQLHLIGHLRARAAASRARTAFRGRDCEAGSTRIRPVLMTAGGDDRRHGPDGDRRRRRRTECGVLARAVIGGLLFGTCTTLLVVPYLYAMLRRTVGEHKRNEIDFGDTAPHEKGQLA